MNISDHYKGLIVNEFRKVAKGMKDANYISQKIYWFSATFGIVNRILNLEFDDTLVCIHIILNATYNLINHRADNIKKSTEAAIDFPQDLFKNLQETILELSDNIEHNNEHEIFKNLQKIAKIAYSTTGNGYYLYLQGKLQL